MPGVEYMTEKEEMRLRNTMMRLPEQLERARLRVKHLEATAKRLRMDYLLDGETSSHGYRDIMFSMKVLMEAAKMQAANAAHDERAKIVAYLRALPVPIIDDVASIIETGGHLPCS